ncbi:MAG: septum formation initiator family protein [Bacteroidota bacterium]|nr:septum formation initiator family protein [Bacteroidota bacterium]|tara:strand:+ start:60 stop:368 length:309 start_codon:yes stop_codon:yes gene_type:complete
MKNLIANLPKTFKNKYIITLLFFTFWILFIDDYNLIKQYQLQKDIEQLEKKKAYYLYEIEKDSTELYHLKNTQEAQEKFAREKFLMKKENEDIFIIRSKKNE